MVDASSSAPTRRTARAEAFVADHADQALAGAGALALGASGVLPDDLVLGLGAADFPLHQTPWSWALVPVGVGLTSWGVFLSQRRRGNVAAAEQNTRRAEQEALALRRRVSRADVAAQDVMNRLCEAFNSAMLGGSTERVTVYRHDGANSFQRLARYSKNTVYLKSGRFSYPDDQGVVGAAWEHGSGRDFMPEHLPDTDEAWLKYMSGHSGIGKRDLKNMRMKSRSLVARRIMDEATHTGCAVLMYESTRRRRQLEHRPQHGASSDVLSRMDDILQSELGQALSQAVAIVSRIQPAVDPVAAEQEGF